MSGILVRWFITTVAIMVVPYIIPGVQIHSFWTALFAAAMLGVLNALIRPILIILTLPLTVLTLGFFILVVNALMFELAAFFVSGLQIASFWSAFFASIVVSIVSWLMSGLITGGPTEQALHSRWDKGSIDMRKSGGRWE